MTHLPSDFQSLSSGKELGCSTGDSGTTFRLFAPRAVSVRLVLFTDHLQEDGEETPMRRDSDGVWEHTAPEKLSGGCYGYRIDGPEPSSRLPGEMFDPGVVVADPYSKAVVTRNSWRMPARTLITTDSYRWRNDNPRHGGLREGSVIYEAHVRDLTAHPSSGVSRPGTYTGLTERDRAGGLGHILSLGVDAVEFLPLMKFGTTEIPFMDRSARTDSGKMNTWNPYARNHWGYMTSFFFAPETYYATDGTMEPGAFNGADGRAGLELRELIDTLHGEGIAVIMDVVYNHTSHYDHNPLKYADKHYYYHCDPSGNFTEESGCGNDLHTGRPMTRRLIADSVSWWMKEYRVDGFRFDLAAMIDPGTIAHVTSVARGIRPDVILIAEPWGGGRHHPPWFDDLGWASWNDRYRDTIRGQDPAGGRGFIFGGWRGASAGPAGQEEIACVLTGTLRDRGGLFSRPLNGINYIEAHDGYTLGDFIRLAAGEAPGDGQTGLNRLAAITLLTSAGPVMIHEGQEYARSKVIAESPVADGDAGQFDHNSYNKDNDTNYLDYAARDLNRPLLDYYRGLIGLRRRHPAICSSAEPGTVEIPEGGGGLVIRRIPPGDGTGPEYLVLLNTDPSDEAEFSPPGEGWSVLADARKVHSEGNEPPAERTLVLPSRSGAVLCRGRTTERKTRTKHAD